MKEFIEQQQINILRDGGYHHHRIISPDESKEIDWNQTQKSLRSVVETAIGLTKNYQVAGGKFLGTPELQQLGLLAIYQLTNIMLKAYPLRLINDEQIFK